MAMQKLKITVSSDDLISVAEAAKQLRVHYTTVWRWIENGEITVIHIGKHILVPIAEVNALKDKRTSKPNIKNRGE
jgi:excisionase family DNA binding protein